MILFVGEVF